MNLSVNCWITGQSPSALAEEISTYEANIQKDVYENHLKQGNRDDWNGYTLNLFLVHLFILLPVSEIKRQPDQGNFRTVKQNLIAVLLNRHRVLVKSL